MSGVVKSVFGGDDAEKAAKVAQEGAIQNAQVAERMYLQARSDQSPYRYVGNQALNQMARLMGFDPYQPSYSRPSSNGFVTGGYGGYPGFSWGGWSLPGATPSRGGVNTFSMPSQVSGRGAKPNQTIYQDPEAPNPVAPDFSQFYVSPDYNFRLDEGIKALDRSAAANGMLLSGAQAKALSRYGQGMASQEYGNYWNRLAAMSGIGQTGTNATQNAGSQFSAQAGNALQDAGDARASGYLYNANAKNSLANSLLDYGFDRWGQRK